MMNTCRDFNTKQKENEMKLNLSTNFNNKLGKILISHNKEIFSLERQYVLKLMFSL